MIEVLPIKLLTDEDNPIFGSTNVTLGVLSRAGLPVASGIVVTAPHLKLKTTLEQYDFKTKEVFEQTLSLVRKEISKIAVPEILTKECVKVDKFLFNKKVIRGTRNLWSALLEVWIEEIKVRLWSKGFYDGVTQNLDPQVVTFIKKITAAGFGYFDQLQDDSVINIKYGKPHPKDLNKLHELIKTASKKLFMPFEYEWILDHGIKLTKVLPFTPSVIPANAGIQLTKVRSDLDPRLHGDDKRKSAMKVFADFSTGFTSGNSLDGIYIASEKIYDLNKPHESFDNLAIRVIESATTYPLIPVFLKMADKSEGMGKVRGSLRLLHQKSLLDPMLQVLDFARHKKGLTNVHVVIPFVRGANELLEIKRELAIKKLMRKNSLQQWLEIATPENIVNLEEYLLVGIDGVVLNLDELVAHLNGFDHLEEELNFYKNEVRGLLKFLEDALKLLHKSKIPVLVVGSITLNPQVLEFLAEKGVWGIVVERYEAPSISEMLYQTEKRLVLRRSV